MKTGVKTFLAITIAALAITTADAKKNDSKYIDWANKVAKSEMKHNPELWTADFLKKPKWDYTHGLVAQSMLQLYEITKDTAYYNYVKRFSDFFIHNDGTIETYKVDIYSLDKLNGGKFLFDMYDITKEDKYIKAICLLRSQINTHPRMKNGVMWHKKVYPEQVWLDGLYMADPFYAQCIKRLKEDKKNYNDVAMQFIKADSLTVDSATKLNYHAYDDARQQKWANKETGHSAHFWGRSMGWYMMAMVDVLDYLPKNHPDRPRIISNLNRLSNALLKYQDDETGLWYQVTNFPKREGNYLESSSTIMYVYAFAKGARKGYLSKAFATIAKQTFDKFIKNATITNPDGTTSITKACGVAGLGGKPYRDGTYEYYIGEKTRNDDPKVVGPFILTAIELSKSK